MLKNRSDRDIVFISEKKELMKKIKYAHLKRVCDQQIKGILPEFLSDPQLLVGKIIQHRVVEEDCDNEFWEKGEVLRIFKTNIDIKRTVYEIKYDSEPDATWKFPLLIDKSKGDLLII